MLHAADIFLTPQQNIGKRTKDVQMKQAIVNKLASIQRGVALMITGAMKPAATDIVEIMANLIPFNLLIDKYCQHAAIRLATLLPMHPLYKPIKNAVSKLVKCHATLLHDLMHRFNIHPQSAKTIKAVWFNTERKPKIKTKTASNTDKAIEDVNNNNPDVKVFTNIGGVFSMYTI